MTKKVLYIIMLFLIIGCAATNQRSLYDKWIRIEVDKKDGSRYIERNKTAQTFATLKITPGYLYEEFEELTPRQIPYRLKGDSILQKNIDFYKLKSVNDSILVLLENDDGRPDDKVNRYTYLREHDYPKYIFNKGLIEKENDSTIILNKYFFPYYNRAWQHVIHSRYNNSKLNGHVSMVVMLDSIGKTKNIDLVDFVGVSEEFAKKVLNAIEENTSWDFSSLNRKYNYKINMVAYFVSIEEYQYAGVKLFVLHPKDNVIIDSPKGLTLRDIDLSLQYFRNGLTYLEKNESDSAKIMFSKCIKIDSLYTDAYYNRAYIYYQTNMLDSACFDWDYLYRTLGQKSAEKLYKKLCQEK